MSAARRLRRGARGAAPVLLAALLAACAGRPQPQATAWRGGRPAAAGRHGYYVVGAPYEVNGVWYYPKVDYRYDHTGIASWYGPGYNGRLTADGEIFDMNRLSAAHPTLPLPSIVRVTDLENGRSLDLRVNDRGPFLDGRIIDLSRRAAEALGFARQGTAPVRVRILKRQSIEVAELAREGVAPGGVLLARSAAPPVAPPVVVASAARPAVPVGRARSPAFAEAAPPPGPAPVELAALAPPRAVGPPVAAPSAIPELRAPRRHFRLAAYHLPAQRQLARPAAEPDGHIFIQAGAFAVPGNARRVSARIAGLARVEVSAAEIGGVALYRVRLGPFASVAEANRVLARVIGSGYTGARLVHD